MHAIQPSWVCKGLVTMLSPKASREVEQPGERGWLVPGAAAADATGPSAGPAGQTARLGARGKQREALRAGLLPPALRSTASSRRPRRLGLNKHASHASKTRLAPIQPSASAPSSLQGSEAASQASGPAPCSRPRDGVTALALKPFAARWSAVLWGQELACSRLCKAWGGSEAPQGTGRGVRDPGAGSLGTAQVLLSGCRSRRALVLPGVALLQLVLSLF